MTLLNEVDIGAEVTMEDEDVEDEAIRVERS